MNALKKLELWRKRYKMSVKVYLTQDQVAALQKLKSVSWK